MEELQHQQNWANSVETNCQTLSNQLAIIYLLGFVRISVVKEKDFLLLSRKVRNKVLSITMSFED
jgi:hypothetical protein